MTSPYPLDTGIMELDKLIHSFEFENQQYVKMIEKENQLIISLESQIQEKIQESVRLEEDVSRFDEDTKRLHRLYTNNRDNIENLKNTINVLSDHEVAISRQLEVNSAKTEEKRKFYKTHIANYCSINEDYMKKYMKFPLAIELEKKRVDLSAAQTKLDEIKAVKQDLKDSITSKEDELDSKVMTRIVVKILSAKTKLTTYQLEKEIHECLAEKTDLVEKLKDIRTSKQPEQIELDYESNIDKQNMETEDIASEHMDGCAGQRSSEHIEGFSNMCISEDQQKSFTEVALGFTQYDSNGEPTVDNTEDRQCPGAISYSFQGAMHPDMNVDAGNVWSIQAPEEENFQLTFTSSDLPSGDGDYNSTPVSYLNERNIIGIKQFSTPSSSQTNAPLATMMKPHQRAASEDPIASPFISASSTTTTPMLSWRNNESITSSSRTVVSQQSGQQSAQTTYSPAAIAKNDMQIPPSLRVPRLSVPKPPRVPPLPTIRIPPKLPEQCNLPPSCAEIKRPQVPPFNMLKDFRQKLNLSLPRLPAPSLHQISTLTKAPVLKEQSLTEPASAHQQSNNTQASQFQTRPSSFSSGMLSSTQVHASLQFSRQLISSNEEPAAGKQTLSENPSRIQTQLTGQSSKTLAEITNVEIPKADCDTSPVQSLFTVNIKGSRSPSAGTKEPKGNYHKSPTHKKNSVSESSQNFSFKSMFGNFEKDSNEDSTEIEEAAPASIFSLFNVSQNQASGNTGEDSDPGTFFTLGKFTDETGSPSADGGPIKLFNFFPKSQNSESSNNEFALNQQHDGGNEDEGATFKLVDDGKKSYFSHDQRGGSDEEGDKPLFTLLF